jgi:hypothetical protein
MTITGSIDVRQPGNLHCSARDQAEMFLEFTLSPVHSILWILYWAGAGEMYLYSSVLLEHGLHSPDMNNLRLTLGK